MHGGMQLCVAFICRISTKYETCAVCTGFIFCTFSVIVMDGSRGGTGGPNHHVTLISWYSKPIVTSFLKILAKSFWISTVQLHRSIKKIPALITYLYIVFYCRKKKMGNTVVISILFLRVQLYQERLLVFYFFFFAFL